MTLQSEPPARSWGSPVFTVALAAFCVWYFWDAWSASAKTANLILIGPAVILGLVLCGFILREELRPQRRVEVGGQDDEEPNLVLPETALDWRSFAMMALVVLFVLVMTPLGFDVSAALFTAGSLWLLGERRPLFIVIYAVAFAAASIWLMRAGLTYGIPTLIL